MGSDAISICIAFRGAKAGRPASDRSNNDPHLPQYFCDSVTELLQFRTVLSVLLISFYVKPICVLIAFRPEYNYLTSFCRKSICIIFVRRESRRHLTFLSVWIKSYKYEPEFIPWSTTVISDLSMTDGLGSSRRNRLCRDAVEAVILASSLFRRGLSLWTMSWWRRGYNSATLFAVADRYVHSSERVISAGQFILGNAVLFDFILK